MANYTRCAMSGRAVEFKATASGMISVGVGGLLVGNYRAAADALFAAAERMRMATGCGPRQPTIPARTRRAVEAMETVEAAN